MRSQGGAPLPIRRTLTIVLDVAVDGVEAVEALKGCQRLARGATRRLKVSPACSPEPRSRGIGRVPRPGRVPARLQANGGKRVNIILVCERGATEPEQVFGSPDPRKARLGLLRAFRSPRLCPCGPTRLAPPCSVLSPTNIW